MIKVLLSIAALIITVSAWSQVNVSRQVISPFGLSGGDQVKISSTAGQPEYTTEEGEEIVLTQGFQQPEMIDPLEVDYQVAFPPCSDGTNGNIQIISISGCVSDDYEIFWNGEPGDLLLTGVSPGKYLLEVTGPGFCSYSTVIDISPMMSQDCELSFYNVIFPNGEQENHIWIIENISLPQFSDNSVKILNRWGQTVWSGTNYDNSTTVFRGLSRDGEELPDGTYFYVVEAGDNEFTGFIELLR